jgi:hypothetical protein
MLLKDDSWSMISCYPFWQICIRSAGQGAHPSNLKTHFNIILPSARQPSNWFLSCTLPGRNPKCIYHFFVCLSLVRTTCTCSAHLIFLDFISPLTINYEFFTTNFSQLYVAFFPIICNGTALHSALIYVECYRKTHFNIILHYIHLIFWNITVCI